MREIRPLRLTWRALETWPWWNGEPNGPSKEPAWKPFTYRARQLSTLPGHYNNSDESFIRLSSKYFEQLLEPRNQFPQHPSSEHNVISSLP